MDVDESMNSLLQSDNGESYISPPTLNTSSKHLSLFQTYLVMLRIIQLKPILRYILFIFIVKVRYGPNFIQIYLILSESLK